MRSNGLDGRGFIRAGQTLNLPNAAGAAPVAVAAADTPTPPPAAVAPGGEYVVRNGDSIDRIARRLGVEQETLLAANDIANRNRIYAGQVLRVPGVEEAPVEDTDGADLPALARAVADTLVPPVAASFVTEAGEFPAIADEVDGAAVIDGENAEADLDSNVLSSTQATLAADPSDYTVAADDTIEVQAMETLGHYADWLELRTQRLRDVNGMPFTRAVVYGQRIRLDFSRVDRMQFEQRRVAYQEQLQEAFFLAHQIADIKDHVIRTGESVWVLAQRTYDVPVWLLRQYNPDLDLDRVAPGTIVKFPELQPITADVGPVSAVPEVG
jgi:membrane-bound lytic murein transglycosylase D